MREFRPRIRWYSSGAEVAAGGEKGPGDLFPLAGELQPRAAQKLGEAPDGLIGGWHETS